MSEINKEGFSLSSYDPVTIEMAGAVVATEDDVDAQLFEYVSNANRHGHINSLQDLDDEWVRSVFPNMSTIKELREHIKKELGKEMNRERINIKYEKCQEALVQRLQGELPANYVEENLPEMRKRYEEQLKGFGMTVAKYLAKERITEEEYEERLRDDMVHKAKFNIAVDLLVDHYGAVVGEDEITDYLSCENPETYVEELKAAGSLEAAKHAAAAVKVMRKVVDEAIEVEA